MPVICVVKRGKQEALPVLLLETLLHAEAGAKQRLQGIQEQPDVESQCCQRDRWNIVDPNLEDLRKEQKQPDVNSS